MLEKLKLLSFWWVWVFFNYSDQGSTQIKFIYRTLLKYTKTWKQSTVPFIIFCLHYQAAVLFFAFFIINFLFWFRVWLPVLHNKSKNKREKWMKKWGAVSETLFLVFVEVSQTTNNSWRNLKKNFTRFCNNGIKFLTGLPGSWEFHFNCSLFYSSWLL